MTSHQFGRILVAVDDSPAALAAAHLAVDLAASSGAHLRFVHVLEDGELVRKLATLGHGGELADIRRRAAESLLRHVTAEAHRAGGQADGTCLTGAAAALLVGEARDWGADLVVVGRSDVRVAGSAYVGAVTRGVLEFSEVPVLVVPVSA